MDFSSWYASVQQKQSFSHKSSKPTSTQSQIQNLFPRPPSTHRSRKLENEIASLHWQKQVNDAALKAALLRSKKTKNQISNPIHFSSNRKITLRKAPESHTHNHSSSTSNNVVLKRDAPDPQFVHSRNFQKLTELDKRIHSLEISISKPATIDKHFPYKLSQNRRTTNISHTKPNKNTFLTALPDQKLRQIRRMTERQQRQLQKREKAIHEDSRAKRQEIVIHGWLEQKKKAVIARKHTPCKKKVIVPLPVRAPLIGAASGKKTTNMYMQSFIDIKKKVENRKETWRKLPHVMQSRPYHPLLARRTLLKPVAPLHSSHTLCKSSEKPWRSAYSRQPIPSVNCYSQLPQRINTFSYSPRTS